MSEKQHAADLEQEVKHVMVAKTTEGGHCLNRHEGRVQNTCSHQWQAYKKMLTEPTLYNWPKYQGVVGGKHAFLKVNCPKGESPVQIEEIDKPKPSSWDVGHPSYPDNFNKHCNVPYYHEAHHEIPNSTLRSAIEDCFGESDAKLYWFRKGLTDAGYNLNHKTNMIMLPLEKKVGKALGLPTHRQLPEQSHNAYSKQVKDMVTSVLSSAMEDADKHDKPKFKDCRNSLETLSEELHEMIKASGAVTLNKMDFSS